MSRLLTERQLEIVLALVYEYIQTGEPVGSRTLSKKYLTDHSAATVRNEMADLEDMGFFTKPHSSAGRLPSSAAYRVYVDSILSRRRSLPDMSDLIRGLDLQLQGLDNRLRDISQFLSRLTQCLGVVALRVTEEPKIRKIELLSMGVGQGLALLVDDRGGVSHGPLLLPPELTERDLEAAASLLSSALVGFSWSEGVSRLKNRMADLTGQGKAILLDLIAQMEPWIEGRKVTYDAAGVEGLYQAAAAGELEAPEPLMRLVEHPAGLEDLFDQAPEGGIKVLLGGENAQAPLQDCALVLASGSLEGRQAVMGLVGPLRMNYQKSIAILDLLMETLVAQGKES